MANYGYSIEDFNDNMARASLRNVSISRKASIEISKFLKGKNVDKALIYLQSVLKLEKAIPYTRFNGGVGHRSGKMGPGRYPLKAVKEFIHLLNNVKFNASEKGLSDDLVICHMSTQLAHTGYHQGRKRRSKFKRCHVEIAVKEDLSKNKKSAKKSAAKSVSKKVKTVKKETVETEVKND